MNRSEVLDAARQCVTKDRNAAYGEPEDSFGLIARFWSSYTGVSLLGSDVAAMMALMKLARIKLNPSHEDSWVDLAGYAACGAESAEKSMKPDITPVLETMKAVSQQSPKILKEAFMRATSGHEVYDEDYYLNGPKTGKSNYQDYRWLEDRTIAYAKRMTDHLGATGGQRIHDIGCARGYLVKALNRLGFISTGHDISQWAIHNCDPEIKGMVYWSKAIPGGSAILSDWFHCKDVLEHMHRPQIIDLVQEAINIAKRGMLIIVPLVGEDGEYIYPPDRQDITHVQKHTLDGWLKSLERCLLPMNNKITIEASYHIPGLKSASDSHPFSTGFFTIRKLHPCLPSE